MSLSGLGSTDVLVAGVLLFGFVVAEIGLAVGVGRVPSSALTRGLIKAQDRGDARMSLPNRAFHVLVLAAILVVTAAQIHPSGGTSAGNIFWASVLAVECVIALVLWQGTRPG